MGRHKIENRKDKHPLFLTYFSMKNRCYNKNHKRYSDYGGRGIFVCDRWLGKEGFWNFVSDMGDKPIGMQLDRIENNDNYCADNCKWSTRHEQQSNRRNSNAVVGVSKYKNDGRWRASLQVNGKFVLNKSFKRYEDAVKFRKEAEKRYINL